MRFVPINSLEQQGQLMVPRAGQGFFEQRTSTLNRIRGLLSELGIVVPLKAAVARRQALASLEDLPTGPTRCLRICSAKSPGYYSLQGNTARAGNRVLGI